MHSARNAAVALDQESATCVNKSAASDDDANAAERVYSFEEVSRHCTLDDLWLVLRGRVYNMTAYYSLHPGGDAMMRQAGKDATMAFSCVPSHGIASAFIERKLPELCIGVVSATSPTQRRSSTGGQLRDERC